jgi:hypothetical protein
MESCLQKCKAPFRHQHENTTLCTDASYWQGNPDDRGGVFISRRVPPGYGFSIKAVAFQFFSLFSALLGTFKQQEVATAKEGLNIYLHNVPIVFELFSSKGKLHETKIRKCFIFGADRGDVVYLRRAGG